jgi:DNA-directed RNA polymerase subunit H (RpoH/RPB5)
MDSQIIDTLYRSRRTLLEILKSRGYNTIPYESFGPWEIEQMASTGHGSMRMDLVSSIEGDLRKCRVIYTFNNKKLSLAKFIDDMVSEEDSADVIDPTTTEVIVMGLHPVVEAYHIAALNAWRKHGLRIAFFNSESLVNDPRKHMDVPRHEKITAEEEAEMRKRFHVKSKKQLPVIIFHEDIQARILFLMPDEICKITRGSPTAGEYVVYRVCQP